MTSLQSLCRIAVIAAVTTCLCSLTTSAQVPEDALLFSLKHQRMELLNFYGPGHPRVKQVEKQIADKEKAAAIPAKPDLKKMSEAELRAEIIRLQTRVKELEAENDLLRGKPANPALPRN